MGLFSSKKKVGAVKISIFDDYKTLVEYSTDVTETDQKDRDMVETFLRFYTKTLYNLGDGPGGIVSKTFIGEIQEAVRKTMPSGQLLRPKLEDKEYLIDSPQQGDSQIYSGELYEKSNGSRFIQTQYDTHGAVGFYSTFATKVFLQWLINNLSDSALVFLMFSLLNIHKYYSEGGNYTELTVMAAVPDLGMQAAANMIQAFNQ
jgi:hypothetical protein